MKKLFLVIFVSSAAIADHSIQYDIQIDGITCPFCVATSEKALSKMSDIESISSNLESGIISVCGPSSLVLDESQLRALFLKKGFTYRGLTKIDHCSTNKNDAPLTGPHPESHLNHEHTDEQPSN